MRLEVLGATKSISLYQFLCQLIIRHSFGQTMQFFNAIVDQDLGVVGDVLLIHHEVHNLTEIFDIAPKCFFISAIGSLQQRTLLFLSVRRDRLRVHAFLPEIITPFILSNPAAISAGQGDIDCRVPEIDTFAPGPDFGKASITWFWCLSPDNLD